MKILDVIVVGGGPVGLWTACELRLAGLEVAVLERRSEPVAQSRALTIHGRTLELFAMRGIADRFLAEGRPIPSGHYGALATRLDFSSFDTRFPFTLFLPQSRTETLIEQHALALGVTILWGHRAETIAGDPQGGYAVAACHEHGMTTFHARAVVGADARRSIVRQSAGITFEGHDSTQSVMMGDVIVEPLEGPPSLRMISSERGGVMMGPLGRGSRMRVIVMDPQRCLVPADTPLSLEELSASAQTVLGMDLRLSDPSWLTRFGNETRVATAYRHGNLFIAGDAAHIHMPAGGQGMNVGLQDAMNLGWKLAAVLKGQAPDALLDTYEAERLPVGLSLTRNTQAQTALMTGFDPAHLALRDEMSGLLTIPAVNRHLAGILSGFDLSYPATGLFESTPGAGERVPDRSLILADGSSANVHGLLASGKWLHLSFEDDAQLMLPRWLNKDAVHFVKADLAQHAAVQPRAAAMLIRPDGYCAGRLDKQP